VKFKNHIHGTGITFQEDMLQTLYICYHTISHYLFTIPFLFNWPILHGPQGKPLCITGDFLQAWCRNNSFKLLKALH